MVVRNRVYLGESGDGYTDTCDDLDVAERDEHICEFFDDWRRGRCLFKGLALLMRPGAEGLQENGDEADESVDGGNGGDEDGEPGDCEEGCHDLGCVRWVRWVGEKTCAWAADVWVGFEVSFAIVVRHSDIRRQEVGQKFEMFS